MAIIAQTAAFPQAKWNWAQGSANDKAALDRDAILVDGCLKGRDSAWEELVKLHTRRVYSICYRFIGSDSEAQDLTQEVFLRVFRNLQSFRAGEGSFAIWIARLTRNLLIDHYRKTRRQRATESLEEHSAMVEDKGAIPARGDAMVAGREASEILQAALSKLPPEVRETVILRDLEELEYREVAEVLGVPEGTVKSRLNRGRAELGRLLRRRGMPL